MSERFFTAQESRSSGAACATTTSESKASGTKAKLLTEKQPIVDNQTDKMVTKMVSSQVGMTQIHSSHVKKCPDPQIARSPTFKDTRQTTASSDIVDIVQKLGQKSGNVSVKESRLRLQEKVSWQNDVNDLSLTLSESSIHRKSDAVLSSADNTREIGK